MQEHDKNAIILLDTVGGSLSKQMYTCKWQYIYNTLYYRSCKNTSIILLGELAQFTAGISRVKSGYVSSI